MKRKIPVILLLAATLPLGAQTHQERYVNWTDNAAYESLNPVRLSGNAMQDYGVASLDYGLSKGEFHAIDASGSEGTFKVDLTGLRRIGRFSLSGVFRYTNGRQDGQRWNSSLFKDPDNPFFVCDSLPGNVTTEVFDLAAAGSYRISDRLKAGLEAGVTTGSRSDQSDPRPSTVSSVIPVTAGLTWRTNPSLELGFAAKARIFSSSVAFYNVQPLVGHRYFIMKGMGDYMKRSTSDESGYKRDYNGLALTAALSAMIGSDDVKDFVELSFTYSGEDARDGDQSYLFRGGDFTKLEAGLYNRLLIRGDDGIRHNITLSGSFAMGNALWSDQRRQADMEHGGRIYYEVLSTNTIQSDYRISADASYRFDITRGLRRDFYAGVDARFAMSSSEHYLGRTTPVQKITALDFSLLAGKSLAFGRSLLTAEIGGSYRLPLGSEFGSGCAFSGEDNITDIYCRHRFEYESASRALVHALLDFNFPAGKRLAPGLFIKGQYEFYTGTGEYWPQYRGTSQTGLLAGVYLKF